MRNVLITGGARGIGKAIVDLCKRKGYNVYAPTRVELALDSPSSVEAFIAAHQHICFDIIINNAGINDINLIENITNSEIDEGLQINLVAPIKLIQGFVGKMKEQHFGRIINIGSIWAVVSKEGRLVYSASKNAIHGVTNCLAVELGEYNILVNTVCPGYTLTELTEKNNTPDQLAAIETTIPLKRLAKPEEIAAYILFLISDENTYITGQKLVIDGGFTVR